MTKAKRLKTSLVCSLQNFRTVAQNQSLVLNTNEWLENAQFVDWQKWNKVRSLATRTGGAMRNKKIRINEINGMEKIYPRTIWMLNKVVFVALQLFAWRRIARAICNTKRSRYGTRWQEERIFYVKNIRPEEKWETGKVFSICEKCNFCFMLFSNFVFAPAELEQIFSFSFMKSSLFIISFGISPAGALKLGLV